MQSSNHTPVRALALVLAALFLAPALAAPAAANDGAEPQLVEMRTDLLGRGAADLAGSPSLVADAPPAPAPEAGLDVDDPGQPYGFPNDNTLGFTTKSAELDRWMADTDGSLDLEVQMGELTEKKNLRGETDYIMELSFTMTGSFWFDGDGKFDPVTGAHDGEGDDPCPEDPMRLFTVYVNGRMIRTVEGENTRPCDVGGPESGRTFDVKPVGDDPPYWVRIPKDVIRDGKNDVRFEIHDFVLPAYNTFHSKSSDGWHLYVDTVMIELAAPPLVLSHGWSNEWNPGTGTVPWQPTFKSNIKNEAIAHFGQDPWRWAHVDGDDPILLNFYDKKQDFRKSAREMRTNVADHHADLGFSGKGWIHGHSMGGLATRYYVEVLGGNARIDKLAQTGSPNLGSWEAHAYTYGFWLLYEAADEDYTAKWFWIAPGWPFDCCVEVWRGWRDWWSPDIWAWEHFDGPGHGREHIADFELKPPGSNPPLAGLNNAFPAAGVQYFTVRGDWSVAGGALHLVWAGDGAVGLDSADMNGAIPSRIIDEFHESIPARVETARWMIRYWSGLDLDSGHPPAAGGVGGDVPLADPAQFYPTAPAAPAEEQELAPDTMTGTAFLRLSTENAATGPLEHVVRVDAAPSATLAVMARPGESPLVVTLVAPDGTEHGMTASGDVAFSLEERVFHTTYTYRVLDPVPGEWTLRVSTDGVPPAEGIPLLVTGFVDSDARLRAHAGAARYVPGDEAALLAEVTDGGLPVLGATVTASERNADGTVRVLDLFDDGLHGDGAAADGVYGVLVATESESVLRFDVVAQTADFVRSAPVEIVVAAVADLAVTNVAGAPAGAWGGDAVTLSATVASLGERAARGDAVVSFFDGLPEAGGALLGSVGLGGDLPVGESRTVTLDVAAPTHAMDLFVLVDTTDLEFDFANNALAAAMPFNPTPRTLATITGEAGDGGWFLGPATATLAPFDGSASPYSATYVSVDGGAAVPYSGPVTVASEGAHTLRYWSVDANGNVEPERVAEFGVDLAAPAVAVANPTPGHVNVAGASAPNPLGFTVVVGLVDVVVDATDAGAGVARVELSVDGETHAEATLGDDGRYHALWDSTRASSGNHVLVVTAVDGAGRVSTTEAQVYVAFGRTVQVEKDPAAIVARLRPGGA